jgi:hypothetical protein
MISAMDLLVLVSAANLLAMNQLDHERIAQLPVRRSSPLGGGVDYRLNAAVALRVANLEYIRSWLNPVVGTDFNRGVRFTTGVVLPLGTW